MGVNLLILSMHVCTHLTGSLFFRGDAGTVVYTVSSVVHEALCGVVSISVSLLLLSFVCLNRGVYCTFHKALTQASEEQRMSLTSYLLDKDLSVCLYVK